MKDSNYSHLLALENAGVMLMTAIKEGRNIPRLTSSDERTVSRICKEEIGLELPNCASCAQTRRKHLLTELSKKYFEHQKMLDDKTNDEIKTLIDKVNKENTLTEIVIEQVGKAKRGRKPKEK